LVFGGAVSHQYSITSRFGSGFGICGWAAGFGSGTGLAFGSGWAEIAA